MAVTTVNNYYNNKEVDIMNMPEIAYSEEGFFLYTDGGKSGKLTSETLVAILRQDPDIAIFEQNLAAIP